MQEITVEFFQVFLMRIYLSLYVVHIKNNQLNIWGLVVALVCVTSGTIAYFADTQLHNFVARNEKLKHLGHELVPNLDEGLWSYSRHANYFAYVTVLVEERMLKQEYMAEAYKKYRGTTSVWIPWFKKPLVGKEKET
ncbi:hypothetical protein BUALT_Bualt01G0022400 [Buddleja alternifolia]|uniref:Uncharacterized protein n=1 Tax=Buddleja alternifolia TaxID=168488 RepID=A0AAV6YBQ8_9LAMI|nr:hypothetical protein BUALT_Bualt01G0022400 [Buddleja alternifolia]